MKFDINRTLMALSLVEEAFTDSPYLHGSYTGFIAYRIAWQMKKVESFAKQALICGLLHDCGLGDKTEFDLVHYGDHNDPAINTHCRHAYEMLKSCVMFKDFAVPVLYHHTTYQKMRGNGLIAEECLLASITRLSDRFDIFLQNRNVYEKLRRCKNSHDLIMQNIQDFKASLDDASYPREVLEGFNAVINNDDFWYYLRKDYVDTFIHRIDFDKILPPQTGSNVIGLAQLFARIVDYKSHFTYQHSTKMADLAKFLATKMDLPQLACDRIYVAGLLHDIGKLNIDENILNKPGKLTNNEYKEIKRHVTDTRAILRNILISPEVVVWASDHHERLDGSGYPLHKSMHDLPLQSRILAVADVFQAVCQDRPYRKSMSCDKALEIIEEESKMGKLSPEVTSVLRIYATECYAIAH